MLNKYHTTTLMYTVNKLTRSVPGIMAFLFWSDSAVCLCTKHFKLAIVDGREGSKKSVLNQNM